MGSRVIFVRIGWMDRYDGSEGEKAPIGGGKNNKRGTGGGERLNFRPEEDGRVYAYFAVGSGRNNLHLRKVDPTLSRDQDFLSDVLIIFVAKRPKHDSVVVGWYRNANLYSSEQELNEQRHYRAFASPKDVYLVPSEARTCPIPRAATNRKGMGQSNIFYITGRDDEWIHAALNCVNQYDGPNLFDRSPLYH